MTLAEALWEFWSDNCQYQAPKNHVSNMSGKCKCAYFPKYINRGKSYGKAYLELEKVNKMCDCRKNAWWKRHTIIKTFKTCPMVDFLRINHGIKGGGKYYKEHLIYKPRPSKGEGKGER